MEEAPNASAAGAAASAAENAPWNALLRSNLSHSAVEELLASVVAQREYTLLLDAHAVSCSPQRAPSLVGPQPTAYLPVSSSYAASSAMGTPMKQGMASPPLNSPPLLRSRLANSLNGGACLTVETAPSPTPDRPTARDADTLCEQVDVLRAELAAAREHSLASASAAASQATTHEAERVEAASLREDNRRLSIAVTEAAERETGLREEAAQLKLVAVQAAERCGSLEAKCDASATVGSSPCESAHARRTRAWGWACDGASTWARVWASAHLLRQRGWAPPLRIRADHAAWGWVPETGGTNLSP